MSRGWSEDRLGFQSEGLFCKVQHRSQWQLHLSGHASKKKARPDCHVCTAARNSPAAPKWRPPPVSTFPALSRTFWQPGKCAHPRTSVRVKALPRDPFPPVHGPGLCSIYTGKHNIKGKQAKRRERKRKRTQAATLIASANPGNTFPHSSRGTIHL